jgi:hypothetical protein
MNTALQTYDPETQRIALLQQYNPHAHILQWTAFNKQKNRSEVVNYYPASWRLYELNLKYPTAKFDIDIIHMDVERDFCIVRARLFTGDTFESSPRRAVAHKQGKLTQLDKVETQAKARAARDLGISTELALDIDDGQVVGEIVGTVVTAESHSEYQEAVETVEAPKQLPQPTKVRPQVVQSQSSPQQESKLLPGQFNALKSLYLRLNQKLPPDLSTWTFAQAAATIQGLQAKLRQAS